MLRNKTLEKIILFNKPDTDFKLLDIIISKKPTHFCIDNNDLAVGLLHIYCGAHNIKIDDYKIYGYELIAERESGITTIYLFVNEEQHNYIQDNLEGGISNVC